ncbi:hypothetical protein [Lentzea sp. CA-135723]|uniref:hypothetical protein n=1 Tax=Lentzea sp. CA-135723 TaxID=3239950 RepID=UPI003D91EAB1
MNSTSDAQQSDTAQQCGTGVSMLPCQGAADLFHRYPGEFTEQPVYVVLDLCSGYLYADWAGEISGTPIEVHTGFVRRFPIPPLAGEAANRLLAEVAPLAGRMLADWSREFDGHNTVAVLGPDASAAETEIEALTSLRGQDVPMADLVQAWDIEGATNGGEVEEFGITATTTDGRLAEIEAEILLSLSSCAEGAPTVCPGLGGYLEGLRQELIHQRNIERGIERDQR